MAQTLKVPFVDLYSQYQSIKADIDGAISSVIRDSAYIKGKYLEKFENEFATFIQRKYCIGCANGTDAIEIALRALNLKPGDEVLVPANTWISTAEAVTTAGGKPVFVDCLPKVYTIDPSDAARKISDKTKGIIPVHLYGLPAEMDQIMALANKHKLWVIEDCAQSVNAKYKGRLVGTFGNIATFSFFPGKNLGAYGDAGAMTMDDPELQKACRMIGDHGRLGKFDHGLEGRNSRLDGLQAAILSAKLPYLNRWTEQRQENAAKYVKLLNGHFEPLPSCPEYSSHVYHLFVLQVDGRETIQSHLESKGIASGIHYPIALPYVKAYQHLNHTPSDFPVAHRQMNKLLSIPMFPELSDSNIAWISAELIEAKARAITRQAA